MNGQKVMIFGAAKGSLGEALAREFVSFGAEIRTYGITGHEDYMLNPAVPLELTNAISGFEPHHIVVTIGVNDPAEGRCIERPDLSPWMHHSFWVNAELPLLIAQEWYMQLRGCPRDLTQRRTFSAISSNSANIARSSSLAYCASKAALSMGLRVVARELAGHPFLVMGFEPGLIRGTPMTEITEERFGPSASRMPGAGSGLLVDDVADQIVALVRTASVASNGVLYRLDAGEQ